VSEGLRTIEYMTSISERSATETTELTHLEQMFGTSSSLDTPWQTIVWNDPVNLMPYVTRVFRTYFGYPHEVAERLMLQVHHEGRAVVASGPREEMERHTEAMHEYGLWATAARGPGAAA